MSHPEKWLEFDFPAGCKLNDLGKRLYRKGARRFGERACCPYVICSHLAKTRRRADQKLPKNAPKVRGILEKYIREEKK